MLIRNLRYEKQTFLQFPLIHSQVRLGEHPSDCLRRSKYTHKPYNKNKTNRNFIRDSLNCKL